MASKAKTVKAHTNGKPAKVAMPDIVSVKATLLGTTAMLLNPATEEILDIIRKKAGGSKDRSKTREEEAREKLLMNSDKHLIIPTQYLLSALVEAGRHVPFQGKSKISTRENTLLYSFIFDYPEELVLTDGAGSPLIDSVRTSREAPDGCWWPDFRRGRNPSDKVMVALVRPRFENWALDIEFKIRTHITSTIGINPSKVRELFEIAGAMVGLGDFRPSCRGPFGCYQVIKWETYGPDGVLLQSEGAKGEAEETPVADGVAESEEEAVAVEAK